MADKNVKFGVKLDTAKEALIDAELKRLKIDPVATLEGKVGQLVGHYRKAHDVKTLAKCDCGGVFPAEYKACPYCGDADDAPAPKKEEKAAPAPKVDATKSTKPEASKPVVTKDTKVTKIQTAALVKAQPVDEKLAGLTAKDLDTATQEVIRLKGNASDGMWQLGAKLKEIHERQLWKLRMDDKGKPTYRSFEAYCAAEIKMSHSTCYGLIKIADNYTVSEVRALGTSKLNLILKAPEDDREELKEAAKSGLSKEKLRQKVAEARKAKGAPKQKEAKVARGAAPPVSKGRPPKKSDNISIVSIVGNTTLPCYPKPQTKGETLVQIECPKAVKEWIERVNPFATHDFGNGVRELMALAVDSKGRLQLRVKCQRIEE